MIMICCIGGDSDDDKDNDSDDDKKHIPIDKKNYGIPYYNQTF